jgi:hypothetical protein
MICLNLRLDGRILTNRTAKQTTNKGPKDGWMLGISPAENIG